MGSLRGFGGGLRSEMLWSAFSAEDYLWAQPGALSQAGMLWAFGPYRGFEGGAGGGIAFRRTHISGARCGAPGWVDSFGWSEVGRCCGVVRGGDPAFRRTHISGARCGAPAIRHGLVAGFWGEGWGRRCCGAPSAQRIIVGRNLGRCPRLVCCGPLARTGVSRVGLGGVVLPSGGPISQVRDMGHPAGWVDFAAGALRLFPSGLGDAWAG